MNYTEAIEYIESIGKFSIKDPLGHAKELLRRVGNPQNEIKVIHVAGTNGKGSVCAYLDAMLRAGGYRCGLFTSPHLIKINERFKINGQMINDEDFLRLFLRAKSVIDAFVAEGFEHPSYFEIMFLIGVLYFKEQAVDYAVLETGLGGRLDATNTVDHPLACIITSISLDHTEYLGNTTREIAYEKAGIIKKGIPVIFDGTERSAAAVIEDEAEKLGSPWYLLDEKRYKMEENTPSGISFVFDKKTKLKIPYIAAYQMMNSSLAYYTMQILKDEHGLSEEILAKGIAQTDWEGRMETVLPGVILDGAHNRDGVRRFIETAVYFKQKYKITILFSAVADKEHEKMIGDICREIQPDVVVATQIEGDRIVPAAQLKEEFVENGCEIVLEEPNIGKAFELARENRGDGLVFCVGSLYLVGEIKKYIGEK